MLNKFWAWLLGLKDEDAETAKPAGDKTAKPIDTEAQDEGNFRSGPDGYQSGGYEGH